jgi:chromosome segregation ATPase
MFQLDKEYSARLEASQLEINALRRQLAERPKPETVTQMAVLHQDISALLAELNEATHRNLTLAQELRQQKDRTSELEAKLQREAAKLQRLQDEVSDTCSSTLMVRSHCDALLLPR